MAMKAHTHKAKKPLSSESSPKCFGSVAIRRYEEVGLGKTDQGGTSRKEVSRQDEKGQRGLGWGKDCSLVWVKERIFNVLATDAGYEGREEEKGKSPESKVTGRVASGGVGHMYIGEDWCQDVPLGSRVAFMGVWKPTTAMVRISPGGLRGGPRPAWPPWTSGALFHGADRGSSPCRSVQKVHLPRGWIWKQGFSLGDGGFL
ncbi:hypothetical protein B0T21DRAFT_12540 [Apiosordaria backusii]|uniref:Uncharacterized protein n=1 Tax=Apiosordaria backusii TaxID=314023 RepID=A0AA40K6K7_9PEZI|nr:hypothetical protein B0T21DRAFT_12540 [Apiosordaria backusii]